MRYHFRREIFTLGIPCAIALIFVLWSLHSGFASTANPLTSSAQSTNATIRNLEVEALGGNLSAGKGIHTSSLSSASAVTSPVKGNLYLTVVIAPVIALLPYSIDVSREERKRSHYEQEFADFLFEMSELVRGGIDPAKAFLTLSQGVSGSITRLVRMAAMQMQIGFTFEQAIKNLGNALQSPLASRYIDLVIQASYSGGSVSNLIQNASVDMGNFLTIEKEKKSGLSQYVVVLYMGQVILIVLCAILVVQFLPQLTSISSIGSIGGGTSNSLAGFLGGASDIGSVPMERDMFFLVYLNGLFGGLVIGKISSGRIKDGIKHSLILLIIALLAWDFYVLPASSSTGPAVQIHVVSYPTSGLAGFKTSQPLVVNVTNSKGAPIPSEVVKFIVAGGGIANPATTPTDSEGEASTVITLSGTPGPDVVLITAGISYATVSINATAGVGNSGS